MTGAAVLAGVVTTAKYAYDLYEGHPEEAKKLLLGIWEMFGGDEPTFERVANLEQQRAQLSGLAAMRSSAADRVRRIEAERAKGGAK